MRNLAAKELEAKLPKLRRGNYRLTSDATPRYNCMAFANGSERKWWEAGLHGGRYYWPPGMGDSLDAWVRVFTSQKYELTANREVELTVAGIAAGQSRIHVDRLPRPRDYHRHPLLSAVRHHAYRRADAAAEEARAARVGLFASP